MHTSLDGFVAGPNGEMDWIHVDEEIFDFGEKKIYHTDTALYGRKTFEMMEGYWPTAADQPNATRHDINHSKWYKKVAKIVLSRTMKKEDLPNATIVNDNLSEVINSIKKESGSDIIIFGSPSASHSLMEENLIDEFWLFVNPILVGEGIPMFDGNYPQQKLTLKESHVFSSGVICLHYVK